MKTEEMQSILPPGEYVSKKEAKYLTVVVSARFDIRGRIGGTDGYLETVTEENLSDPSRRGRFDLYVPDNVTKTAIDKMRLYCRGFIDSMRGYEKFHKTTAMVPAVF